MKSKAKISKGNLEYYGEIGVIRELAQSLVGEMSEEQILALFHLNKEEKSSGHIIYEMEPKSLQRIVGVIGVNDELFKYWCDEEGCDKYGLNTHFVLISSREKLRSCNLMCIDYGYDYRKVPDGVIQYAKLRMR